MQDSNLIFSISQLVTVTLIILFRVGEFTCPVGVGNVGDVSRSDGRHFHRRGRQLDGVHVVQLRAQNKARKFRSLVRGVLRVSEPINYLRLKRGGQVYFFNRDVLSCPRISPVSGCETFHRGTHRTPSPRKRSSRRGEAPRWTSYRTHRPLELDGRQT